MPIYGLVMDGSRGREKTVLLVFVSSGRCPGLAERHQRHLGESVTVSPRDELLYCVAAPIWQLFKSQNTLK